MTPACLRRLCCALVAAGLLVGPTVVGGADASAAGAIDGPDVSSYQHPYGAPIKWAAVKAAGKEFALVKATEGTSYKNPWFATDYSRIRRVGMVRGSYHFARPAYPIAATATAQARYYARRLGTSTRMSRTLPPALDLEMTGGLSRGALVTWAQTFLLTVRRLTGRTPMIYTYPSFWTSSLADPVALARFPLWMASYSSGVGSSATLWQYTSTARVRGIRGSVDMSRLVAPTWSWKALADGRPLTPWPARAPGAPQAVSAHATAGHATVSWLPGDTGSKAVTNYRVTASPGGASAVVDSTHFGASFSRLSNGTSYTFTVRATNSVGAGAASLPSAAVTPLVPTKLTIRTPASVVYGSPVAVRLTLTRPDTGTALANRTVAVRTRQVGTSTWSDPVDVVTDSNGRAVTSLVPTGNVDVRATFSGPVGWSASSARSRVLVATGVTATLTPSTAPRGTAVVLGGTTTPATAGVVVTQQALRAGAWQVLQTAVTDDAGAFAFTYTPVTPGVKSYRVVVDAVDGRAAGVSPVVQLTVT
jgi:GH25 family lysozyme M1 (1,4-beta-N-acetylmuramidase)